MNRKPWESPYGWTASKKNDASIPDILQNTIQIVSCPKDWFDQSATVTNKNYSDAYKDYVLSFAKTYRIPVINYFVLSGRMYINFRSHSDAIKYKLCFPGVCETIMELVK